MSLIACGSIHEGHEWFGDDSRGRRDFYVFGSGKKKRGNCEANLLYVESDFGTTCTDTTDKSFRCSSPVEALNVIVESKS